MTTEHQESLTGEAQKLELAPGESETTPGEEETVQSPPKPKLTSEEKLARLRENYERRTEELEATDDPSYKKALEIAERLEGEPNVLGIYRVIELFGSEFVDQKATEAIIAYKRALKGPKKFEAGERGTLVSTKEGKLRTSGGIFFYMMVEHNRSLGRTWVSMDLPWYPFDLNIPRPRHAKKAKPEAPKASRSDKRRQKR